MTTVTVDPRTTLGPRPHYERMHSKIQRVKGPLDLANIKALGPPIERMFHRPSVYSLAEGQYDWNRVDRFNAQDPTLAELPGELVAATEGIPAWLLPPNVNPDHPNKPPLDWAKYEQVLADGIVHRHQKIGAHVVECYNETDLQANSFDEPTRLRFYDAHVNAVRKANAAIGSTAITLAGPVYLRPDAAAIGRFLDHVNTTNGDLARLVWHAYNLSGTNPRQHYRDTTDIAKLAASKGFMGTMMATEWGLSSAADRTIPTAWNLARDAAAAMATIRQQMDAGLQYSFKFAQSDYNGFSRSLLVPTPLPSDQVIDSRDGKVFPSYNAYRMLSLLPNTRVAVNDALDANGLGVGAVAAVNDTTLAVLIWNYLGSSNSSPAPVTIQLGDPWPGADLTLTRYLVDATHSNWGFSKDKDALEQVAAGPLSGTTVDLGTLAPNAVTLVVANRAAGPGSTPTPDPGPGLWQQVTTTGLDHAKALDAYDKYLNART